MLVLVILLSAFCVNGQYEDDYGRDQPPDYGDEPFYDTTEEPFYVYHNEIAILGATFKKDGEEEENNNIKVLKDELFKLISSRQSCRVTDSGDLDFTIDTENNQDCGQVEISKTLKDAMDEIRRTSQKLYQEMALGITIGNDYSIPLATFMAMQNLRDPQPIVIYIGYQPIPFKSEDEYQFISPIKLENFVDIQKSGPSVCKDTWVARSVKPENFAYFSNELSQDSEQELKKLGIHFEGYVNTFHNAMKKVDPEAKNLSMLSLIWL